MSHSRRKTEVLAAGDHDAAHVGLAAVGVDDVLRCNRPQIPAGATLEVLAEFCGENRYRRSESGLRHRQVERGVVRLQLEFSSCAPDAHLGRGGYGTRHAEHFLGDYLSDRRGVVG